MMRCPCCNRDFRSRRAYELYLAYQSTHAKLRAEVAEMRAQEPDKRTRKTERNQEHRMGQA